MGCGSQMKCLPTMQALCSNFHAQNSYPSLTAHNLQENSHGLGPTLHSIPVLAPHLDTRQATHCSLPPLIFNFYSNL